MKTKKGIIIGLIGCVAVLCLIFLGIATSHNPKKSTVTTHTTKKSTSSTKKSSKSSSTTSTTSTTTTTTESSTTQEQIATPAKTQTETETAQPAQAPVPSSTYTPGVGGLTAEDVAQEEARYAAEAQQAAQDQAAREQWHDDQVEWAIQNGYYNSSETGE
ncbi:MAG: hypothetical protein PUG13_07225 [Streptococcus hyointestinalis]|nr:hypothetical protein [Streptococcus hyointestinalis]MDD6385182.1 hypothetical protein [Streptococcus hyointestinalis]